MAGRSNKAGPEFAGRTVASAGPALIMATTFVDPPPGLTSTEARDRLAQEGMNLLPVKAPMPAWRQFVAQLVHFFALMLWVAGALAILAGMPQLGAAIFAVVIINAAFAFAQEYRAQRAGEKLRDLLPRRATVMRDGVTLTIDARQLVRGDVVLLASGDRISADLSLSDAHGLAIDTSTLTGESAPSSAQPGDTVFAGTFVVEGEGVGVVSATGKGTRLAGIARMTWTGLRPPTPLAAELERVVRAIAWIAMAAGLLFLAIAVLVGIRLVDGFLFAIGVTVALVPEGLLPTVTLALAMGAQRMAARNALVRRLESVETLGSTTFICTDKTGTLTHNQMSVVEIWTPQGGARIEGTGYEPSGTVRADPSAGSLIRELALAAARCSTGRAVLRDGRRVAQGDPTEAAIDVLAQRLGIDVGAHARAQPLARRFPFDPRRRRMSVVAGNQLFVKGAPEAVLPRCLNPEGAEAASARMAERGLRVIVVATRTGENLDTDSAEEAETQLEMLGLLGFEDPPRPGVADAIAACRRAGIRVAMVTGDHPGTARAIAREVRLLAKGGLVLEGSDLPQDEQMLGALVDRDGIVISRVTPENKLRIARALRMRGHVVAMTGDGVNDGPALQEAAIGIAMGLSGTDVAREAADLVLLDDNFATIVAAIEQGRTTFANTRRFLTYHLTDNVAELAPFVVWALSGGRFPLALGVLQVLCLDVGTDILPALALGAEPPSSGALQRRESDQHLVDHGLLWRAFALLGLTEAVMEMAGFLAAMAMTGWRPGAAFPTGKALLAASGAAFSAVVIGQMANAFACRSTSRWPGTLGWTGNRFLLIAVAVELLMLLGFLYVRPVSSLLGQSPPNAWGTAVAILAFPAVIAADALQKRWKRNRAMPQLS